jgi:outer membrane protein TolC
MRRGVHRWRIGLTVVAGALLSVPARAQAPAGGDPLLDPPVLAERKPPTPLEPAGLEETERPLPINLATALYLADARALVIEAAQAGVQEAAARLEQARLLWLPTIYAGIDYQRHDGSLQSLETGELISNNRNALLAGGGASAIFGISDALIAPLAARQVLRARNFDVQAARNDALLETADAFFRVQQARGRLAGALDTVSRALVLVKRVEALGRNLIPPVEADRVRTALADLEQTAATFREDWRLASEDLTRLLRLDAAARVVPLEPPQLQVTLIAPGQPVDDLIPIGLATRPELASQQALVQAALARLRQERLRPLVPSVVIQGNASPGQRLLGGVQGAGVNDSLNNWGGRSDIDMQLIWELRNLGFGNQARVREREAQRRQALVELFRVQDRVAAEVGQAHAQLASAAFRVGKAESGLKSALVTYEGNLRGLSETVRVGDLLQLVSRPQEVVAALQALQQAYTNYFGNIGDYNRAQFRLYRALGYPALRLSTNAGLSHPRP